MSRRFPESPVFYRDLRRSYLSATRAEGVYVTDENGKVYLDACGGALVTNLGHGRPELAQALYDQVLSVDYVHGSQFTSEAIEAFSAALVDRLPPGLDKVYLVPGGAEATETAIKLARQYQLARGRDSRYRVVSCLPGYHGNTLGALSVSGREGLREPYAPLLVDQPMAPAPFCFRCPLAKRYPECELACAEALNERVEAVGPDSVAAVLIEPILGASAGAAVPPSDYLRAIREICDRFDLLLVADEVLTGFGRTGTFLAIEHFDVEPDMVLLGKGLSGGVVPAGAVAVKASIVSAIEEKLGAFTHGFTFSHHPTVAAVGETVLGILEREKLIERVAELESSFFEMLEGLRRFDFVSDIRGRGLLAGIELGAATGEPFPRSRRFAEEVVARAFANGLLLYPGTGGAAGEDGDFMLLAPSFTISEKDMEELGHRLEKTFEEVEAARR